MYHNNFALICQYSFFYFFLSSFFRCASQPVECSSCSFEMCWMCPVCYSRPQIDAQDATVTIAESTQESGIVDFSSSQKKCLFLQAIRLLNWSQRLFFMTFVRQVINKFSSNPRQDVSLLLDTSTVKLVSTSIP